MKILILLLFPSFAFSQFKYGLEIGTGISTGKETFATIQSKINPLSFEHYVHKKYEVPSIRIRAQISRDIFKKTELGFRTGVDIHYLEINPYGQHETNFSLPFQLISIISLSKAFKCSVAAGYNFKNIDNEPFPENGGFLGSLELSFHRKKVYYKTGFEYGAEHCRYNYKPTGYGVPETIRYHQIRKQIILAFGFQL